MAGYETHLVVFARILREAGVKLAVDRVALAAGALQVIDPADAQEFRVALRLALVTRREDRARFDAAFDAFWRPSPASPFEISAGRPKPTMQPGLGDEDEAGRSTPNTSNPGVQDGEDPDGPLEAEGVNGSAVERLRDRPLELASDTELEQVEAQLLRVIGRPPQRRTLRLQRGGHGPMPDLRRSLRAAVRSDGELLERHWRRPREKPRDTVLLLDVSGSMRAYAPALVVFAQALLRRRWPVEVFAFGTRLTRVTHQVRGERPRGALERASAAAPDWGGGTRIAENLGAFNDVAARRGIGRGAAIVVFSDGWERGEVGRLDIEMGRLARLAHAVLWANPLAGLPGYEPLAGGMATALPHVHALLPGRTAADLIQLAQALEGLSRRRIDVEVRPCRA